MVREEGREFLEVSPRVDPVQGEVRRHALELRRVVADQDLHHRYVLLRPVGADRRRVEDVRPLLL